MPFRHDDGGEDAALLSLAVAEHLETPGPDGGAGGGAVALMAVEHGVEPLLVEHRDRFVEPVEEVCRRRVGEVPARVRFPHVAPVPVGAAEARAPVRLERLRAHRVERQSRRQHQPLLRAGDGDVDAPFVEAEVERGEARDRVDHQERRVARRVDRAPHVGDGRDGARGGFVVDDADGLNCVVAVLPQSRLDPVGIGPAPPVALQRLGVEAEPARHLGPERGEVAGLVHQHLVARVEHVHERGFPGASPGGGKDEDLAPGLEDPLHAGKRAAAHGGKVRSAMVNRLP